MDNSTNSKKRKNRPGNTPSNEKKQKLSKEKNDEHECLRFAQDVTFAENNFFSTGFLLFDDKGDIIDVDLTQYLAHCNF